MTKIAKSNKHMIKESYYRTQLEYTDGLGLDSVAKIQWYTSLP